MYPSIEIRYFLRVFANLREGLNRVARQTWYPRPSHFLKSGSVFLIESLEEVFDHHHSKVNVPVVKPKVIDELFLGF